MCEVPCFVNTHEISTGLVPVPFVLVDLLKLLNISIVIFVKMVTITSLTDIVGCLFHY